MNIMRKENETKKEYTWRCVRNVGIVAAIFAAYLYMLNQITDLYNFIMDETKFLSHEIKFYFNKCKWNS